MDKLGHKEGGKGLSRAIKTATTILTMAAMLHTSLSGSAQKIKRKDIKIDKKVYENNVAEWKKMESLREKMMYGKYGSEYMMSIFDGKFVGPNHKTDFGIRNYTTAYDELVFGKNLMALLVNLGFDAKNIRFIPASQVEGMQPYKLGCIKYYGYSEEALRRDIEGKPSKKGLETGVVKNLTIVPGEVEVNLAALEAEELVGKEKETKRILLPQIKNTGSFKDANNFDLAYDWMETIWNNLKGEYDISKRQFSSRTPSVVRDFVLQHFDAKKNIDQYNQRNEKQIKKGDSIYNVMMNPDLISMPNTAKISFGGDLPTQEEIDKIPTDVIVSCGRYQVFRFFTDVYRRKLEYHVYKDESSGKKKLGVYNTGQNPVWHNAFQNDADPECDDSTRLSNRILLNYGSQNHQMPTLIPKKQPGVVGRPGVKLVNLGEKPGDYADRPDIMLQTLNGRMLDANFYEYAFEQGILPLNDDGTVEHIYRVAVASERDSIYWAYIFCGKKAGVRGGRQGKSFVNAVDLYREFFPDEVYYQIIDTVDAQKGIDRETEKFIARLEKLETQKEKAISINARVFLNSKNPNDPNKDILEGADLFFLPNNTAILMPGSLVMPWEIVSIHGENDESVIRKKVKLTAFGKSFYMKDIGKFHKDNIAAFKKWKSESHEDALSKYGMNIQDSTITKILYEGELFELDSVADMYSLIKRIDNNVKTVDQEFHDIDVKIENHKKTILFPVEEELQRIEDTLLSDPDYLEQVEGLDETLEDMRDQRFNSAYYLKEKQQLKDSLQQLNLGVEDSLCQQKKQDIQLKLKKLKEEVLSDSDYQKVKQELEKVKSDQLKDSLYLKKKAQYLKEYSFVDKMEKAKDSLSDKKNNLLYREKGFIEKYLSNLRRRLESVNAEIASLSAQIEDQKKALLFHKDEEKAAIKDDIKIKKKALHRKEKDRRTVEQGIREWQGTLDTKFAGYD